LLDQSGFTDLGRVYLGEHVETGRRVQFSTIEQTGNRDSEAFQRFIAEVRKIAGISHANLVQIVEIVVDHNVAYLVTEHVEGRDLQRVIEKEHPLPPATAADYVRQAAAGMAEVHGCGLVHGELRPSNLLLTEQGRVKVSGMSMACLAQNPPQKATTADAVNYLSPEQVRQDGVGPASDVYALGAIFYHLLTGRPPFLEGTATERLQQHLEKSATPVAERRSDVPKTMAAICERMLAKSPADRYPTAKEVAAALAPWEATFEETEDDFLATVMPTKSDKALPKAKRVPDAPPVAHVVPVDGAAVATHAPAAHAAARPAPASHGARPAASRPAASAIGVAAQPEARSGARDTAAATHAKSSRGIGLQTVLAILATIGILAVGGAAAFVFLRSDDALPADEQRVAVAETANASDSVTRMKPVLPQQPATTRPVASGHVTKTEPAGQPVVDPAAPKPEIDDPPNVSDPPPRETSGSDTPSTSAIEPTNPPAAPDTPTPPAATPFSLEQLPASVALPPLDSDKPPPADLGLLSGPPPEDFAVELIAAEPDGNTRLRRAFSIRPAVQSANDGARFWEIALDVPPNAEDEPNAIAKLRLLDEQLMFGWTGAAAKTPNAELLQNCLLRVSGEGEERFIALRKAVEFPAIVVQPASRPSQVTLPVQAMPDPVAVRVELEALRELKEETPQKFHDDKNRFEKPADETAIVLGEGESTVHVGIRLKVSQVGKRSQIRLDVAMAVQVEENQPPLTVPDFAAGLKLGEAQLAKCENDVKVLTQAKENPKADKKKIDGRIGPINETIKKIKAKLDKYHAAQALLKNVGNESRLHFRVYFVIDGHEVDMVRTVGEPAAEQQPPPDENDKEEKQPAAAAGKQAKS
jgi:hypothetical protein